MAALATKIQRVPERQEGLSNGEVAFSMINMAGLCLGSVVEISWQVSMRWVGHTRSKRMQVSCKPCEHSLTEYESVRIELRPTSLILQ